MLEDASPQSGVNPTSLHHELSVNGVTLQAMSFRCATAQRMKGSRENPGTLIDEENRTVCGTAATGRSARAFDPCLPKEVRRLSYSSSGPMVISAPGSRMRGRRTVLSPFLTMILPLARSGPTPVKPFHPQALLQGGACYNAGRAAQAGGPSQTTRPKALARLALSAAVAVVAGRARKPIRAREGPPKGQLV